ncbi:GNAT family N-acetyltransferase [Vallitalea pronyensis]|uniref:GNAT family N-acetyltransferase n=1 Tax=Vallitalea pronyensis TaxID=1348613 RepID=A0A8J8SGS2_9FIRM|nr:GNAT family N-acetyltransferase [Vallitalea pronyensis]QUI23065.1 GNAT family N-acetyltransferase [Vallitalea pronyensis]
MMEVQALKNERIQEFINYCKKHRHEVDESYLYDEDLDAFQLNHENPTYVGINGQGNMVAAVSLIIDDYNRRGKRARFRIFHSEIEGFAYYNLLMKAILLHTGGLDNVYLFVPIINKQLMNDIKQLHFTIERYSYFLVRDQRDVPAYNFPEGYTIRPFQPDMDEEVWCDVRNAGFAKLKGSETPITPENVKKMIAENEYIEGGMMILYDQDRPIGIVKGEKDDYEGFPAMNIGPLAIIPDYQGKGLGRCLLRASLQFAKEKSYTRTTLCVNAENERAKSLYIQEGFKQVEAVACFHYDLTNE